MKVRMTQDDWQGSKARPKIRPSSAAFWAIPGISEEVKGSPILISPLTLTGTRPAKATGFELELSLPIIRQGRVETTPMRLGS